MQQFNITRVKIPVRVIVGMLLTLLAIQQFITFPASSQLERALNNALHVPLFFIFTLLIWQLVLRFREYPPRNALGFCAIVSIGLALLTEFSQFFTGRDASLGDVGLDMIGSASALLVLGALQEGGRRPLRLYAGMFAAMLLFLSGFYRVGYFAWLYQWREQIAPRLIDFDGPERFLASSLRGEWELIAVNSLEEGDKEGKLARIHMRSDRSFPGVRLQEPLPDWSPYRTMILTTYMENEESIPITLRVETSRDRGMGSTVEIRFESGWRRQEIPISSLIRDDKDMPPTVRALLIFSDDIRQDSEFYLEDIHLE